MYKEQTHLSSHRRHGVKKCEKCKRALPKLDGDWANIDGLLFNPLDPIKIDEGGPMATGCGGLISKPAAAAELVGTILTYGAIGAIGDVYVLNDDF
jgi:hypothetical protein